MSKKKAQYSSDEEDSLYVKSFFPSLFETHQLILFRDEAYDVGYEDGYEFGFQKSKRFGFKRGYKEGLEGGNYNVLDF